MVSDTTDANVSTYLQINGSHFAAQSNDSGTGGDSGSGRSSLNAYGTVTLKRGDYFTCNYHGTMEGSSVYYNNLTITEVG